MEQNPGGQFMVIIVSTDYLLGRSEKIVVEVSGLTEEQISHITCIVKDLEKTNG
jgi:hypothetical protein